MKTVRTPLGALPPLSSVARQSAIVVLSASLASWLYFVGASKDAEAGVVGAFAGAFDLDVNLTITQPPLPPLTITTPLGLPFNAVGATGPAGAASSTVLSLVTPATTASALTSTASTTFTPGGPGSANASASIGSFSYSIPLISTSFTSGLLQSSATSASTVPAGPPTGKGTITRSESATIVGGSLTILGFNLGPLAEDPARNTTIFDFLGVTVVLNNNPVTPFPNELVDAVEITFTNTPWNITGGLINGTIDIAESQTALAVVFPAPPPVSAAEPGTASLIGSGIGGMLLLGWIARRKQRHRVPVLPAAQ